MPKQSIKKESKGFTMVEMMVAIFVLLVGITGGVAAIVKVITLTSVASSKLTAVYLVQEGLELVRNIRDTNWLEARTAANDWDEGINPLDPSNCDTGCIVDYLNTQSLHPNLNPYTGQFLKIDNTFGYYSYSAPNQTKFQRKITIGKPSNDILDVTLEVMWMDRGASYTVTAREQLYNWR